MKLELLEEFSSVFYEAISEIEIFIPDLDEQYNKQQVQSLKRRFVFLKEEAEKSGIELLARMMHIFIDFLDDPSENYHCLTIVKEVIIDSFKLALELLWMENKGEDIPDNYEEMVFDSFVSLFSRCAQRECDCSNNEVKAWVLVADDEESIRTYVEDVLFSCGFLVLSAHNGRQAISAASTGIFKIIFTDINMPYKSGYDLLYYIQENSIDADVIVFTGFASAKSVSKAIHGGAYDYIGKPFNGADDILNAAERALQHYQLENKNKKLMDSLRDKNLKLQQYTEGLEEALRSLDEKTQALVKAERMATVGVLVAGLAHEINNPNTFIRGNIQTLKKFWPVIAEKLEGLGDEDVNTRLKYIIEEMPSLLEGMFAGTERVSNITRGLKAFARVDDLTDKMEDCDVRELLDSALTILENKINSSIIIEKNIEQTPKVYVAKQQIVESLVNIIDNSLDAIGNLKVQLITLRVFAGNGGVSIEITDNGYGIRDDIKEKIFDPFFTTKAVDKGTGLGLSIAEGVISSQSGRVQLVKSDADGTTMEVFLPSRHSNSGDFLPTVLMLAPNNPAFRAFEAGINAAGNYNLLNGMGECRDIDDRLSEVNAELVIIDAKWSAHSAEEFDEIIASIKQKNIKVICVVDSRFDKLNEQDYYDNGVDKVVVLPCSLGVLLEMLGELIGL